MSNLQERKRRKRLLVAADFQNTPKTREMNHG